MSKAENKKEEYASHWMQRIQASNKYFEDWEKKFKCRILNDYIEGQQSQNSRGYVLNLIYSSLKVKKPSLLFTRPTFTLEPKPWKTDWNPESAYGTAQLKQDTINSFIQDSALNFAAEIDMALLDSWSYFGMIEVGYDATWIQNPNAGLPVIKKDYYELGSDEKEGTVLKEPFEIPEKEFIYFKRIPAHRFRVGGTDSHDLNRCSWCGYYEFIRTEDLLASKKLLQNISEADWPSGRSDDYYENNNKNEADLTRKGDYTKVWKIWDVRSHDFLMLSASPEKCIFKKSFKRLPLFPLRFDLRRSGFYPIPVIFNWKSPQDEINESREQMRRHRRRVRQFWQAQESTVDPDEVEKFIQSPDGTLIFTKKEGAIAPINNSPLDNSIIQSLQISSSEFDKISGTSDNQRGVSSRTTATESNTIETRTRVREETDQNIVAEWLCNIAKEALMQITEKFTEPFWIKRNQDEGEMGEEIKNIQARYQLIHASMLDDSGNFDVNCSVISMSPVANELEKKKFFEFMAILQNYPILSMHPLVIREAAYRCGYRNEQVIKSLQQMSQLAMMAKVEEGNANMQQQNQGNASQQTVQQVTPPDNEEIRGQIEQQIQ